MPPAKKVPLLPHSDGISVAYEFTEDIDDVPVRFLFGEGANGRFVCFRIEVGPSPDSFGKATLTAGGFNVPRVKPISTQTLRKIPVASLIEAHLLTLARSITRGERLTLADAPESSIRRLEVELGRKAEMSAPSTRRPGRPPKYGDEHWQEVARVYLAHGGRAPRKAVAEHFGVSLRKADNWIATARRKNYLPPHGEPAEPA